MEIDVASEYGSDFTPDEEEILQSLLQQAPAAKLTGDHALVLEDIEDHESSRGARVPRTHTALEQLLSGGSHVIHPNQASLYTLEVADDSKLPASGKPPDIRGRSSAD